MDYYVYRDGGQKGPFSDDDIKQMIEMNLLSESDLIWREGMEDWRPLSKTSHNQYALCQMENDQAKQPVTYNTSPMAVWYERISAKFIEGVILILMFCPLFICPSHEGNTGVTRMALT